MSTYVILLGAMAENVRITFQLPPISSTELPSRQMVDPPALVVDWLNLLEDILNIVQAELEFPNLFRSTAV